MNKSQIFIYSTPILLSPKTLTYFAKNNYKRRESDPSISVSQKKKKKGPFNILILNGKFL